MTKPSAFYHEKEKRKKEKKYKKRNNRLREKRRNNAFRGRIQRGGGRGIGHDRYTQKE